MGVRSAIQEINGEIQTGGVPYPKEIGDYENPGGVGNTEEDPKSQEYGNGKGNNAD